MNLYPDKTNSMETIQENYQQKLENPWRGLPGLAQLEEEIPEQAATIYCHAQSKLDKNGMLFSGSIQQQITESFEQLKQVLRYKQYTQKDVAGIHFNTTSLKDFFAAYNIILQQLKQFKSVPFTTVKQVKQLALPSLLFELEATATQ